MKLQWIKSNVGGPEELVCIIPDPLFCGIDSWPDDKVRIDFEVGSDGSDRWILCMQDYTYECKSLKEAKTIAIQEIKKEVKRLKKVLSKVNLARLK